MVRKLLLFVILVAVVSFAGLRFGPRWFRQTAVVVTPSVDPFAGRTLPENPKGPVVFVESKARMLHRQVAQGDFSGAAATYAAVLAASKMEAWHFAPMNLFMDNVTAAGDDAYLNGLNRWIEADKTLDIPWLLRAQYYHNMSWRVRGNKYVSKTPVEKTRRYYELRRLAISDANTAVGLNDRNPYSFFLLLNAEGTEAAFRRGVAKFPNYYGLHRFWLGRLEPKWGGSVEAMNAFVHEFADPAPTNSPMKMLYLDLYIDLLDVAGSSCGQYTGNDWDRCLGYGSQKLISSRLEENVRVVTLLYSKVDPYQYASEMVGRLKELATWNGAEARAATILQMVADAMHGTTALVPAAGLSTNFVLDQAAGSVWYHAGNYENAETLYFRSLSDLRSFDFPDEESRVRAVGANYDYLVSIYLSAKQYDKVLAARGMVERFLGVGGGSNPSARCQALFNMNRIQEAIDACTELLNNQTDMVALRFRGKAYQALKMTDKALDDLRQVAGSNNRWAPSAAIDMTVIYGDMGAYEKQLQVFADYPFLFDPEDQTKNTVAVAYNNRCFAYLKLRRLKEALSDCEESLKYETIPDALQKKQEILKAMNSL